MPDDSSIAPQNVTREPRQLHMEVMNLATGDVWLCQAPITSEEFKALRVAPPLVKSGCTTGSFDAAHFLRSPGASIDGPLETCALDGRTFSRVAKAVKINGRPGADKPMQVTVDKHHSMTFQAGRSVTLARLPDGRLYVQQTEDAPGKTFSAPADWHLTTIELRRDWTVLLPAPVSVWFFASLRSFMGPVDPPPEVDTV